MSGAPQNKFNTNTVVMSICTFIILAVLGWVGRTSSQTHDTTIEQGVRIATIEANISEIKVKMLTRTDLSVELLKLQVSSNAKQIDGVR